MSVRRPDGLAEEALTHSIIGAFFEVYNTLGFGFLESVYMAALERELVARGHTVAREVSIRVSYKGDDVAWQRLDMLVDNKVVVESKSSALIPPTAARQLQNYLRATKLEVGLLLHFGAEPRFVRLYAPNTRWHQRPSNESEVFDPIRKNIVDSG